MAASRTPPLAAAAMKSVVWTGVFLGIGLMGAVDEIAFHQLLQWHNFYVHTDQSCSYSEPGACGRSAVA